MRLVGVELTFTGPKFDYKTNWLSNCPFNLPLHNTVCELAMDIGNSGATVARPHAHLSRFLLWMWGRRFVEKALQFVISSKNQINKKETCSSSKKFKICNMATKKNSKSTFWMEGLSSHIDFAFIKSCLFISL